MNNNNNTHHEFGRGEGRPGRRGKGRAHMEQHGRGGPGEGCGRRGRGGRFGSRRHGGRHWAESESVAPEQQTSSPSPSTQSFNAGTTGGVCRLCNNRCSLSRPGCPKGYAYADGGL